MNGNAELLNFIYQNAQMGVETISQLTEIVEDQKFKEHLKKQYDGYVGFHKDARELLNHNGYDEKGISAFKKITTYLMINFQTIMDKSVSHIAEMMITGSSMGITDAIKHLHQYTEADRGIRNLMEKLQKFEEQNVEKLKTFL